MFPVPTHSVGHAALNPPSREVPATPVMKGESMSRRKPRSKKWIARSRLVRAHTDHCVVCFSQPESPNLHVHHLVYKPGGRGSDLEKPEDMVVLCLRCHDELHLRKLMGRAKFVQFRDEFRKELVARELDALIPEWIGR